LAKLTVAPTRDRLLRDGRPFFYLADTAWMAFSNLDWEDWIEYLDRRRVQGFNALQISILPILHDRSVPEVEEPPFLTDESGAWDFHRLNPVYFDRAEVMLEAAVARGFTPCLTVLWCTYVPETRGARISPIPAGMPQSAVRPFAAAVARRFARFEPLLFISGDTRFESPYEESYYREALLGAREAAPNLLLSMHLNYDIELPRFFADAIDLYTYQSGHHLYEYRSGTRQPVLHRPYSLIPPFRDKEPRRPVLNSEPCYEGQAMSTELSLRWDAAGVRRASWQSVLGGAKVGIAYGAHGVWSFHKPGQVFLNARAQAPFPWKQALDLPGASDMGYLRFLVEIFALQDLDPADLLIDAPDGALALANADRTRFAVYCPFPSPMVLACDCTKCSLRGVDLQDRKVFYPDVDPKSPFQIGIPPLATDWLLFGTSIRVH
jgi:hypothetical protein